MPEAERTVKRSEIIIAGIYCITAVTLCILMQRKNLPELLLVLSSGHAVHWAGVNINLLKKCNTETVPANIETRPSALGMSDPIMEFQGTPEQPQNNLKIL